MSDHVTSERSLVSAFRADILNAQEEIYTELRDQATALDHQSVDIRRQIEAAQARVSRRIFDESYFISSHV